MDIPVVSRGRCRSDIIEHDQSALGVLKVAVVGVVPNPIRSLTTGVAVLFEVISLADDHVAMIVDVAKKVVGTAARQPVCYTRLHSGELTERPERSIVGGYTRAAADSLIPSADGPGVN